MMSQTKKLNAAFLALLLFYMGGSSLISFLFRSIEIPTGASMLISQLLVLIPIIAYQKWNRVDAGKLIQHRPLNLISVVYLILIALCMEPVLSFLNAVSMLFVKNRAAKVMTGLYDYPLWYMLILVALIPAVTEEYVCRGILFHTYRRHGLWKSMLVSGLFFGILHLNFNQFAYAFFIGMIFPVLIEATGSIFASILVHFSINGIAVMLQSVFKMAYSESEYTQMLQQSQTILQGQGNNTVSNALMLTFLGIGAVIGAGLLILLIWLLARSNQRDGYLRWSLFGGEKKERKQKEKERIIDPFFILYIVIGFGFMLYSAFVGG